VVFLYAGAPESTALLELARPILERHGEINVETVKPPRFAASTGRLDLQGHCDPLVLGASIGRTSLQSGSIGFFCRLAADRGAKPAFLTAAHVAGPDGDADMGADILQPYSGPKIQHSEVGWVYKSHKINKGEQAPLSDLDVAIVEISPSRCIYGLPPNELPYVPGCPAPGQSLSGYVDDVTQLPPLKTRCGKVGAASGYTEGVLSSALVNLPLILTTPDDETEMLTFLRNIVLVEMDTASGVHDGDSGGCVFLTRDVQTQGSYPAVPAYSVFGLVVGYMVNEASGKQLMLVAPMEEIRNHFGSYVNWP